MDQTLARAISNKQWVDFTKLAEPLPRTRLKHILYHLVQHEAPQHVVEMVLKKRVNVNEPGWNDPYRRAALLLCLEVGNYHLIPVLLDAGAYVDSQAIDGETALYIGVFHNVPVSVLQLFLDAGCDVNPVHARTKDNALSIACVRADFPTIQLLIRYGANVNCKSVDQLTPLMRAAGAGRVDVARALLQAGAKGKTATNHGANALHHAVSKPPAGWNKTEESTLDMLRLLLVETKCDVLQTTDNRGSVLINAIQESPTYAVIRFLLEQGADPNAICHNDQGGLTNCLLLAMSAHVPSKVLELLIQAGADPNLVTETISGLLNAINNNSTPADIERNLPLCRLLLWSGADVNYISPKKGAALHLASACNNAQLARLLLENGANTGVEIKGRTPMYYAQLHQEHSVARLLEAGKDYALTQPVKMDFSFSFCCACRQSFSDLVVCSGCMLVAYCDEQCQRKHWPQHKPICQRKRDKDERMKLLLANCVSNEDRSSNHTSTSTRRSNKTMTPPPTPLT